MYAIKQLGAKK